MKALTFYGKRDLRYEDVEIPVIQSGKEVIVKVKAAGICGSDIARYRSLGPYVPGNIWGHEFAGEIVAIGPEVENAAVGDHVACCPTLVCHQCSYCQGGHPAGCDSLNTIGAYAPGAFAEYVRMPSSALVKMPEGMSFEEGALSEPAAVAIHGLYQTEIRMGYEVAVVGCGNIGLMCIAWAKAFGAKKVYALDISDTHLKMAEHFGADVQINTTDKDFYEVIREYCDGVDLAIESAGNPYTAARVLGLPHKGGEVVYMGIPYADVAVPRFYFEKIMRNELRVKGSWCTVSAPYPGKEWRNAVDYIGNHKVHVADMISHREPLSKGPELFERIIENPEAFGKVMLCPELDG